MPSIDLIKMPNAKECARLAWRPKREYLCTKYAHYSVFLIPGIDVCGMHNARVSKQHCRCVCNAQCPKMCVFWQGAPNAHTSAPNMPPTGCCICIIIILLITNKCFVLTSMVLVPQYSPFMEKLNVMHHAPLLGDVAAKVPVSLHQC